ncbi:MAG: hypothetical protein HYU66_16555 [Armatimonadetes bacterium]|nr:hypothetical protein [Armatimonadota bacterium]
MRYAPAGDPADDRAFAEWCSHPLLPQATAEYLCGTGVLGRPVFPRTAGVWDSYDAWFDRGYLRTEQDRIANRTFGWMSYGDWFGERVMNHGNSEYDLAWSCAVQWLRCLDRRYFDRGLEMARHYSTTDTIWGAPFDAQNGLVYAHSYNHVGTDLPVDSPLLGTGDVAAYAKRFGQGFFAGVVDRQGHIFQEGNWLYAALTGDPFLRECAERVCTNQSEKLTPAFDYDIERSGGWPLINAVAAYNFSGNPYYLNAARLMIERTLERQEARTGGFPHFHYGSETEGKQLLGGKAFAVGILTHGMLRYLEQEPRPREDVEHSLVRAADWLIKESWVPPDKGFRYITNAPNFANSGDRSLTVVINDEVIAYAFEKTKDASYGEFWRKMMAGQFDGSPSGMGKSFSMATRQTVFGLDRMRLLGVTAAPKEAK